jgi:hypothetical protein
MTDPQLGTHTGVGLGLCLVWRSLAPLVATDHTLPVGSLGPDCAAAKKYPARYRLLHHLRRGQPVPDRQDLIRVTPWASSSGFHSRLHDKDRSPHARVRERPRPYERRLLVSLRLEGILQHEGDLQVDLVTGYVAVLDHDVQILHPRALDVPQGLVGTRYSLLDGILKARL